MKILRFLGVFSVLCAFGFVGTPARADSSSVIGTGQPQCANGVCQVCDGDECANICDSGYWGIGGDMSECTLCATNPGGGFNNTLFGAYTFNRTIGTCYKYCATGSCTDISDPTDSIWAAYNLSGISIAQFDSNAGTRTIGFYQFNSNSGGACNTGTDYCPIIMRCSGTSSACKPRTNPVVFKDGDTTLGTLYVVRQTMWSSQNTNFQDDMNTASYSGVVFPVFKAPIAPDKSGYDFMGYYTAQTGGTQIIGANGQLTQSNAALAETQGTLYAQYQERAAPCNTEIYLDGNGGTISSNCTPPFYPQPSGSSYLTPSISDKCMPVNPDPNCTFTGFYLKTVQYYDDNLGIQIPIWNLCSEARVTLTAGWNCSYPTHKIEYTCGTGTGSGTQDQATENQPYNVLTISDTDCSKANYDFDGWYFSGDHFTHNGGSTIPSWTYGDDQTFTAKWRGSCNLITFDDNNADGTNVNSGNTQRKRTGDTSWYDVESGNVNVCGKEYTTTQPQVSIPSNGNATFRGYFAPNDLNNPIFGTDGYPTSYGNSWTTSASVRLKALWSCPNNYTWNELTKQCEEDVTCSRITFADNNESMPSINANLELYRKDGDTTHWYGDSKCSDKSVVANPHVNRPTWTGYAFMGYYTRLSGGTQIFDSEGAENTTNTSSWNVSAPVELQAQWTAGVSKVIYKCSADGAAVTQDNATYGQPYDLLASTICTNPTQQFTKWKADIDNAQYDSGQHLTRWPYAEGTVTFVAQWEQLYIVQCPKLSAPNDMYQWSLVANEALNLTEDEMNKFCYHNCPENQEQDGWNVYLNTPETLWPSSPVQNPINITGGVTYNGANPITLRPNCVTTTTSVKYLCYKNDEGKIDDAVTLVNYTVRPISWYHQCSIDQNDFNGWLFSGDDAMHAAGSTISPWTYGANETFVPAYNASFDCNTTHWQVPSGGNHATQRVILGDGLSMPAMNCERRPEFSGWLPASPDWTSGYTAGLTSPIPGATCSTDISVAGGGNFSWSCPSDLTFTPDDDLITQTINLTCGSNSGSITVSYGDNISAMVTQWFADPNNCPGVSCAYPTNPTTYAHGYWKICADWNGVTPPGLTPVDGESGCYKTDPANPNYNFSLLDPYWNLINDFSVTSIWRCPKWVNYKCTADSEAIHQDSMSYAAYYEEPYTVLDHETVGCGDTGYDFTKWYKEDQPSVEYDENELVQSWPYDDVVTLVGKYGDANDYNIVYHSLGGNDMNSSSLCQHTFTYSVNAQDFDPDIAGCVPTRDLSTFLGWCASSNTTECTPIEQIPAGQSADLNLYAIWECVSPYHSNPDGTACEACADGLYWNGESCESCATDAPGFPHSKHPFTWSIKTCYRECPSNTTLGATGQTCNANANMYGLNCPINVNFAQFTGSTGKQIELYGNHTDGINTCNNEENTYCARGLFCSGLSDAFKPMTAPVDFYDAAEHQTFGTRYIFGARGGSNTIDLGNGKLWSLLAGPGQKTNTIHNIVNGVDMSYQYTHIIYPTYLAPAPDNIPGMAFDGYYSARTGGTQEVSDTLDLDNVNAMSVISDTTGDSNTARKVYARYSNIDYTLTYNCGDGGTGTPPATVTGIHHGDPITPAANTCQNPGHDFSGWIVSPAGGVKQPGDSFTWRYTDDQVFTADWSGSIIYNINYVLYGGTASSTGMPQTYTYESGAIINGVPTRDHSTFDGWCTDATLTNCAMTQTIAPNTETGDKTFYAKWRCDNGYTLNNNLCDANVINLVYDENGHGVAPTQPSSCEYGTVFTLPAAIVPNPADGYVFSQWTVNGGGFSAGAQIACDYTNLGIYQGTATITATWNAGAIIIDWNENGGAAIPDGSCVYNGNLTLAGAPLYEGHTFNGWLLADGTTYANANSTQTGGCTSTYIGVTSGTSTAITAQWCENCVQPEHGSCTLTPQMNGQCKYTTSCNPGYNISGDGTATPACTPHKYTITYQPNGGTPAENQTQTVDYLANFTTLGAATFSKANNLLTGWHKVSGGNFTALSTSYSYDVVTDTVLNAVWDECTCIKGAGVDTCTTSVSNNACQGVATCQTEYINPSVVCQGTTCNATCSHCPAGTIPDGDKDCVPCPAGTFQFGDSCEPCPDGSISVAGSTACEPCEDGYHSNADHTACDPNTITIVYANGGHGTAPAQTSCQYNKPFTLASAIIAEGYTFNKWSVNNNTFNASESITCNYANLGVYNGSVTITATWNSTMYPVTFDANGGTGGQSTPVQAAYNQPMPAISSEPPVNTGYTFMGWYDNANYLNGIQYYNANGVGTRVYDKTTGMTLYAGWTPNIITLVYDANGHGTAPSSRTCTYGNEVTLASEIFAEGFIFKNWKVGNRTFNAHATITCNMATLGVSDGSVTLVAQWEPRNYIVDYNCGVAPDGNAPDSMLASYNENFTPALHNSCQYYGHTFAGWKVSGTSDIRDEAVAFKWLYTENKTLTAQWDAQTYSISYELNGGTNYASAPHSYVFGIGAIINGTPTRGNSVFKGWCTDSELQNCAMSQTIGRTDTGNKTFYAKWVCTNGYIPNANNTACDACAPGQHAENGQCVDDTIECTLPNATYATRTWNQSSGAYGPCIVETCESDYHVVSNTCVKDTRECALENGYGTQHWTGTTWDKCVAETCNSGFEIVGDNCEECSNRRLDGVVVVSSYANGCEIASCMYHGQKYVLENNECVPICETKSDETGSMAWNESRKKCVRTCNPGYKMW